MIRVYSSPIVQWSSIQGSGPCNPGSNPGGAIYPPEMFLYFY